jgi:hypothetical protein
MSDDWSTTGKYRSEKARGSHRTHRRDATIEPDETRDEGNPRRDERNPRRGERNPRQDKAAVSKPSTSSRHIQDQAIVSNRSRTQDERTTERKATSSSQKRNERATTEGREKYSTQHRASTSDSESESIDEDDRPSKSKKGKGKSRSELTSSTSKSSRGGLKFALILFSCMFLSTLILHSLALPGATRHTKRPISKPRADNK